MSGNHLKLIGSVQGPFDSFAVENDGVPLRFYTDVLLHFLDTSFVQLLLWIVLGRGAGAISSAGCFSEAPRKSMRKGPRCSEPLLPLKASAEIAARGALSGGWQTRLKLVYCHPRKRRKSP